MKTWQQRFGNWLAQHLDLPTDVILELPRITTIGQIHAYIENHKGLLQFSEHEIRLKLNQGQLRIKGKGFVLRMMLPEEILVEGTIEEVTFLQENS